MVPDDNNVLKINDVGTIRERYLRLCAEQARLGFRVTLKHQSGDRHAFVSSERR